jgi:hypothetical protein
MEIQMKKLNIAEASVVIGGTCKTCSDSFDWISEGGNEVCKSITSCVDKNGVVTKTYRTAPASSCKSTG